MSVQQSSVPVAPLRRISAADTTEAATERGAFYQRPSMLDESAWRAIVTGISCSLPLQVGQLAVILIYSRPLARAVSPIFLFDLTLTGLFLAWSRRDAFRQRWLVDTLVWCGALCLSNGAIAVYTLQASLLYIALIIMLVGAAALAPWGARWQSYLALICFGTAVTATRFIPTGVGAPFRLFEVGAVAALTVIIAWLNERTRREVRRSEQEMQAARDAAEAASRAKGRFLSSMSHEIRTPMNAILGMAEVLADSPLTAEQHKCLSIMINNGGALLDLINDILDFARVESGQLRLERTTFDLHEVVERVAETLSIRAHQKKLELVVDIAPYTPQNVIGDPLRVRQVLINLLGNAIKFTDAGEVEIRLFPEDSKGAMHFTVRDTGIGIAADQLEEIFQGYAQADAATARKFGGTGLGLAIVKQLTDLMGGRIWVESQVGRGTTFHFITRFELHDEDEVAHAGIGALHGIRVLIVDDSHSNLHALSTFLAHQGAIVMTATTGAEALARSREADNSGSVILLDCRMAPMDGYETARRMQADGSDLAKVIPMITADDLNVKLPLLRKLGFLRHLIKPVRRAELVDAVQSAGAAAPTKAAPVPARIILPSAVEEVAPYSLDRPMRVLVADDSEDNRLLIDAFLKKTGCSVEHADNGEMAVRMFVEGRYDVVLMDIQMPVMDGYQAVRQIRDWETSRGVVRTPVIALTASVLDEAVGKSFEAGCDTHVSKPIRRATLLTAINEVVAAVASDGQAAAG